MKQKKQQVELSYYGLYLQQYLIENHPDKSSDNDFLAVREDLAADTFEQARLVGYSVEGAQELAMKVLLQGLHFSEFRTVTDILENEFGENIPAEKVRRLALVLLPRLKETFSGYPLSDDFAQSSEYDSLYSELTGTIAVYLDEHGI